MSNRLVTKNFLNLFFRRTIIIQAFSLDRVSLQANLYSIRSWGSAAIVPGGGLLIILSIRTAI